MADFDPEMYLRLIGERELASGLDLQHQRLNGQAQLPHAAAALAVAGVIDPALATSITSDYDLADGLRRGNETRVHRMRFRHLQQATAVVPEPFTPRRVFPLVSTVALADGELQARSLTISESTARLSCVVYWQPSSPGSHGGQHGGPPDLTMRAPSGQSVTAPFGGGWSDSSAEGHYNFDGHFDPDMKWIELAGTRVTLPPATAPPDFVVEPLASDHIEVRYLWQLLADFGDRQGQSGQRVRPAAAALTAAGCITEDDPRLAAVLWASGEDAGQRHQNRPPGRGAGPGSSTRPPDATPAEWKALLSGPLPGPGPHGIIAIGAVSPVFDGVAVALNELSSGPDGFSLAVETMGAPPSHPGEPPGTRSPVAFWASDDRGNHYLGHMNSWQGHNGRTSGDISFSPLDPRARELTLAVSTLAARASLVLALDWSR